MRVLNITDRTSDQTVYAFSSLSVALAISLGIAINRTMRTVSRELQGVSLPPVILVAGLSMSGAC